MSRSTCSLFIGVFSVALYLMMTTFTVLFTFFVETISKVVAQDEDASDETRYAVAEVTTILSYVSIFFLCYYIVMIIASMSMIFGIQKDRYRYITPWLCMTAIGVICELIEIFYSPGIQSSEFSEFFHILTAILVAAMWYPVFRYHQHLKNNKVVVATNPCHTAIAPEFSHVHAKFVPTSCPVTKV